MLPKVQQRPTGSSRAAADQQQGKCSPRTADDDAVDHHLPLFFRNNNGENLQPTRSAAMSEKWIHAIPVAILLCLFTLWWVSYEVNLEMKDGQIVAIHRVEIPLALGNNNIVELAVLAATASSPIPSLPVNFTTNNETGTGTKADAEAHHFESIARPSPSSA